MPQPNFATPAMVGFPRVNWQEQLEQGFQARQAQQWQNHVGQRWGQNEGVPMAARPPPQQFIIMGQRETYTEEKHQHGAHQHNLQLQNHAQRQINHDQEALQHWAHMAELQQQWETEALRHQAQRDEL